ncbi:MAG TPA: hypothetical protein VFR85_15460, partial [Anaeromyxobacteraceae bacterium]|nr:hypothetical protein [Anaeromyxobacteraceae bacterium]
MQSTIDERGGRTMQGTGFKDAMRPTLQWRPKGLALAMVMVFTASTTAAAPGDIVVNGQSTNNNMTQGPLVSHRGFLFEPEVPFTSLKHVPTWSELEQMLDNPYLFTPDPATPGNDQGFPSYRSSIVRRPGFGVDLQGSFQFHVHPLNYNTTTGEEMRLINPNYGGGTFDVVDQLVLDGDPLTGTYSWTYTPATISPGADRMEPGEAAIDYNSPITRDTGGAGPGGFFCVVSLELAPPEGALLCGGDPGEPGNPIFGVNNNGYSTPAVPLAGANPGTVIPATARLFDPARGVIQPRNAITGVGGLNKPSLRVPAALGTPSNPNYAVNGGLDPLVDLTTPSNENDYI